MKMKLTNTPAAAAAAAGVFEMASDKP